MRVHKPERRERLRKRINVGDIFIYIFYGVAIVFFGLPIIWTFSLSLKLPAEIYAYPPVLVPKHLTFENYITVLTVSQVPLWLYNSFKLVLFTVLGVLAVASPAAFAFSRFEFRGKTVGLFSILIFHMITPLATAIPLYRYFHALNLLDTHFGLIMTLIAIQISFAIWLLKGFFDTIPKELDDAALIDGCAKFKVFLKIILPISVPGIAAATIFISIITWAQFLIPFILLSDSSLFPASVGVLTFQTQYTAISHHLVAAVSILAMIPAVIIFLLLQRFIVQVLIAGALKG